MGLVGHLFGGLGENGAAEGSVSQPAPDSTKSTCCCFRAPFCQPKHSTKTTVESKTLRKEACQIDLLLRTKKSLYVAEIKLRSRMDPTCITGVQEKIRKLKLPKGTPCRTVLIYQGELDPGIANED
jgi:hypothetical protein